MAFQEDIRAKEPDWWKKYDELRDYAIRLYLEWRSTPRFSEEDFARAKAFDNKVRAEIAAAAEEGRDPKIGRWRYPTCGCSHMGPSTCGLGRDGCGYKSKQYESAKRDVLLDLYAAEMQKLVSLAAEERIRAWDWAKAPTMHADQRAPRNVWTRRWGESETDHYDRGNYYVTEEERALFGEPE